MYKIITGKEKVNVEKLFSIIPRRGDTVLTYNKKIFKNRCNSYLRRHFFTQWNIDNWNGWDKNVVEAKKMGTFKKRLDRKEIDRKRNRDNSVYLQYKTR